MSDAIVKSTLEFSPTSEQRKLIRDTFANGATDSEFDVLMEVAKARRLNPLLNQIYFVKRWDSGKKCEVWRTQVAIDGLRSIAERTGRYDGQDEPEFEYDKNNTLKACKVRVYRKDISRPFVGVAMFSEYVQTKREGGPNAMWARGPHFMLAKCAEALAFRKGFPEDTAGLYIPEEMGADIVEREVNAAPLQAPSVPVASLPAPEAKPQARTAALKEKMKARIQFVDVRPDETLDQADARAKEEAKKPPEVSLYERIAIMAGEFGLESTKVGSVIRGATGKEKRTQLTEEDVSKVRASLEEFAKAKAVLEASNRQAASFE